jgi:dihydrofolate reductase
MKTQNSVYIAQSLDGYIADKNGGIAWLDSVPNPEWRRYGLF